jgi:hypothetical protein
MREPRRNTRQGGKARLRRSSMPIFKPISGRESAQASSPGWLLEASPRHPGVNQGTGGGGCIWGDAKRFSAGSAAGWGGGRGEGGLDVGEELEHAAAILPTRRGGAPPLSAERSGAGLRTRARLPNCLPLPEARSIPPGPRSLSVPCCRLSLRRRTPRNPPPPSRPPERAESPAKLPRPQPGQKQPENSLCSALTGWTWRGRARLPAACRASTGSGQRRATRLRGCCGIVAAITCPHAFVAWRVPRPISSLGVWRAASLAVSALCCA